MKELDLDKYDFILLAREILGGGGRIRFRAHGTSMRPFIYDGDLLEVHPCDPGGLQTGDIILYQTRRDGVLAHRINKIHSVAGKQAFQPQGDANPSPDGWITPDQVLGKVVIIIKQKHQWKIDTPLFRNTGKLWRRMYPLVKKIYRYLAPLRQHTLAG
jgi:signal peptidase I